MIGLKAPGPCRSESGASYLSVVILRGRYAIEINIKQWIASKRANLKYLHNFKDGYYQERQARTLCEKNQRIVRDQTESAQQVPLCWRQLCEKADSWTSGNEGYILRRACSGWTCACGGTHVSTCRRMHKSPKLGIFWEQTNPLWHPSFGWS